MRTLRKIILKKLLFLFIVICYCLTVRAQYTSLEAPIDSLIIRIPAMMRSNENVAVKMIEALARRSAKEQHRHGVIQAAFFKTWLSYRHNPPDVAIKSIDSALQHIEGIDKDTALVKFNILKGQCYVKKTQFSQALAAFNQALNIATKRNDEISKTSTLISIGWAYMEDGKPDEAIRFFSDVLRLNPSETYENRAVLLCNIAACNNTVGNFKLAESYALKGIAAARGQNNNSGLANGLNILARSYYQQGKLKRAISFLKEAAIAREKVSDPSMLASDYLELANLYSKNEQPLQAVAWAKKAEALSEGNANSLKLTAVYQSLAGAYETLSDHKNAFFYLKKLLHHKDSLSDDHYNQAFAQMQVQFETQKKTAENLLLREENLETKLRNSQQQRWLTILLGGLVLLTASSIYISKLLKSRYKTRLALEQLNEQKKRTLAVMEAEEKERRRIAGDLHDGVSQTLAAASLQLAKAKKGCSPLEKVDELIIQAGEEVRSLSHQVTPELLLHYGLVTAMQRAVDRLNDANEQTTFMLFTHIEVPLEDEMVSLTVYRCFQELCTNVLKHAQARRVSVQLTVDREEVELMIEDDGIGFEKEKVQYGLGMRNIKSRVTFYDGELHIDTTPLKGSTIIIKFQQAALVKTSA